MSEKIETASILINSQNEAFVIELVVEIYRLLHHDDSLGLVSTSESIKKVSKRGIKLYQWGLFVEDSYQH